MAFKRAIERERSSDIVERTFSNALSAVAATLATSKLTPHASPASAALLMLALPLLPLRRERLLDQWLWCAWAGATLGFAMGMQGFLPAHPQFTDSRVRVGSVLAIGAVGLAAGLFVGRNVPNGTYPILKDFLLWAAGLSGTVAFFLGFAAFLASGLTKADELATRAVTVVAIYSIPPITMLWCGLHVGSRATLLWEYVCRRRIGAMLPNDALQLTNRPRTPRRQHGDQ